MSDHTQKLAALLDLSHELGNPQHAIAILGEGSTSVRLSAETFLVKAEGGCLAALRETDVVECKSDLLLPLLDRSGLSDNEVNDALLASRVDASARKPSLETLFHAWLLTLPEVGFVAHTHAPAVNTLLCTPRAHEFAEKRLFTDEVVCCDVMSVFVPYTDSGLRLAQLIRERTRVFIRQYRRPPRVILLENHGIITVGETPPAVLAAMFMAEKAARIWLAAAALGGPKPLPPENVARIASRPDETVR
jgi:rhamnose utilization protein RhaD (predicted bifunctional aldolase and dehydrogenase)